MNIFGIIPAHNEEKNVAKLLNKAVLFCDKLIVVDDGSTDSTYEKCTQIKNDKIILLRHEINLGKGAAMQTGCEAAVKMGGDVLICLDADNQHQPEDIPKFIEKIKQGCDVVFGARTFTNKMPLMMLVGNKVLSAIICKLFKIYLHDTQCGFRAFTAETYQKIKWQSPDYGVETEMIVNVAKSELKTAEVEIATIYLDDYKGTTVLDGLKIFINIIKWKYL